MPGKVNGFSLSYTAVGAVVLWSGITGQTLTSTFQSLLKGQAPQQAPGPTAAQNNAAIELVSGTGQQAGVSVNPPASTSESAWVSSLLSSIGAPQTSANVSSVEDWIRHEGPYGTQGENNPLNTTQKEPGSTSFVGLAVQNYPTATEGLDAIVQTLNNGNYPQILLQLRAGTGLRSGAESDLLKWSGGGYSSV